MEQENTGFSILEREWWESVLFVGAFWTVSGVGPLALMNRDSIFRSFPVLLGIPHLLKHSLGQLPIPHRPVIARV
jgi:hypothetical protein